jgi:hypothetical protein
MRTVLSILIPALLQLGVANHANASADCACSDSLIRNKPCAAFERERLQVQEATISDVPCKEFSRVIQRDYPTTALGTTALYNRYGKVEVKTWNENRVKIDVIIIVNATDQRAADKMFELINVNFTSTSGFIKAETVIGQGRAMQDFKINYEVWLPIGNHLDLRNKYGNSFVANLNGKLQADIKYGDLRTETVKNDADIIVEYGKAALAGTQNLVGQVGYGGLTVEQSNNIQLDTRYSQVTVRRANDVRITSKYDELGIGVVQDLRLQTKYSNMDATSVRSAFLTAHYSDLGFKNVSRRVDADLQYGELNIETMSRGFEGVNITGMHTDVQLAMEKGTSYRFDIKGNCTDTSLPAGAVLSRRANNGTSTTKSYDGYVGDSNAKAVVKINLSYGNLDMD